MNEILVAILVLGLIAKMIDASHSRVNAPSIAKWQSRRMMYSILVREVYEIACDRIDLIFFIYFC